MTTPPSKRKAVQNALGRLGWHVKGTDMVAVLANFGIEVSEGLVSRVKIDGLKHSSEVKRHEERQKAADKRRNKPMSQKKPQQRTYWR